MLDSKRIVSGLVCGAFIVVMQSSMLGCVAADCSVSNGLLKRSARDGLQENRKVGSGVRYIDVSDASCGYLFLFLCDSCDGIFDVEALVIGERDYELMENDMQEVEWSVVLKRKFPLLKCYFVKKGSGIRSETYAYFVDSQGRLDYYLEYNGEMVPSELDVFIADHVREE